MALWYQYYFQLERGRAGLAANRREIAENPVAAMVAELGFDDATFERTAAAFDNPDYVDVVIHSYRHRYGLADGDPQYADMERRLAAQPAISVPAITLDGAGDGVIARHRRQRDRGEIHRPAQPSDRSRARDIICRRKSPKRLPQR